MYFRDTPLYPFGYGLSYTAFAYRELKTSRGSLASTGKIDVNVIVKNTGRRAGDEVVELYVKHLNSKVARPLKELKAFTRIHLGAQEERVVTLPVSVSRLAYWSVQTNGWVVEKDRVEIIVGGSSVDERLRKTVKVD